MVGAWYIFHYGNHWSDPNIVHHKSNITINIPPESCANNSRACHLGEICYHSPIVPPLTKNNRGNNNDVGILVTAGATRTGDAIETNGVNSTLMELNSHLIDATHSAMMVSFLKR